MVAKIPKIDMLLSQRSGPKNADKLLDWFSETRSRIMRGDLMIGILSVDELKKVPTALRQAAQGGRLDAYKLLADWLSDPPIGKPNVSGAATALKSAIKAGEEHLKLDLARLRWFKQGDAASQAHRTEAFKAATEYVAAHPEDGAGYHMLGHLLTAGFGVDADPTAGYEAQMKAAELEESDAEFELYVHLSTGSGVEKDPAAAFKHLNVAADAWHPRALYTMGSAYARGDQVKKDMKRAAQCYDRACGYGNGRACATLAAMYAEGDGVKKDLDKAGELFTEAQDYGFDPSAIQNAIGWKAR